MKIPGRINWAERYTLMIGSIPNSRNLHKIQGWGWRKNKPVPSSQPAPFSSFLSQPYSEEISPDTGAWPPMYRPLLQGLKPPVTHSSETVNAGVFLYCFCLVFCYSSRYVNPTVFFCEQNSLESLRIRINCHSSKSPRYESILDPYQIQYYLLLHA